MSKTSELLGAIATGYGNFDQLIDEIEDINGCSKSKQRTVLHQTCLYNNIPVLEKLLSISDINLNAKDILGRTPLHLACLKDNHQAVAKLVEIEGVDVNVIDRGGETPLHLACSNVYTAEAVAILVNTTDIDANVKDNDKRTPLHKACSVNNHRAVATLIETSGIDVNAEDKIGKTPLFLACTNTSYMAYETVDVLLKSPSIDVNVKSHFDGTPLHNAARNNNVQAMSKLLEVPGIDVNEITHWHDNEQDTPLHIACINKKHEAVVKLISVADVNVNAKDGHGYTPLHHACNDDNYDVFSALIDSPAIDVNAVNKWGKTPLHLVCEKSLKYENRCQVVKKLLTIPRIDVNIKDNSGDSAIMAAASSRDRDILKLLADDKRVDMDLKNNDEKGLVELITETCVTESLDIIKNARRVRELESSDQVDESHGIVQVEQELEDVKANVRNLYIEKIEEVNQKEKEARLKLQKNADAKEAEMKQLIENHNTEMEMMKTTSDQLKMELEQKKAKLKKELDEIEQKVIDVDESMISKTQEMGQRHREEKMTLEEKHKDEDDQKNLDNLIKISDHLAKEMEKLDIDSNVLRRLEEVKEILECPICMRTRMPPTRIWMCPDSHIICEDCRDQLDGNECPTCRSNEVNLRAFTAEKLTRALFHQ